MLYFYRKYSLDASIDKDHGNPETRRDLIAMPPSSGKKVAGHP